MQLPCRAFVLVGLIAILLMSPSRTRGGESSDAIELAPGPLHLRAGRVREWSDFPSQPDAERLELDFALAAADKRHTLIWTQRDVKQAWRVELNGRTIGELVRDENPLVGTIEIPPDLLKAEGNALRIASRSKTGDDIVLGRIALRPGSRAGLLEEARVTVEVRDADGGKTLPARLTILDETGALAAVDVTSTPHLAARPGTVYTATGRAELGLMAGRYRVIAGHGFEYSISGAQLKLAAGEKRELLLEIRREVDARDLVSCDPHIHTLTFSGHGDASLAERLVTIAAEGIELPVATDHDIHIDYDPPARDAGLRSLFTPVVGSEFTTPIGHFNIFPIDPTSKPPDAKVTTWKQAFQRISNLDDVRVTILNHPRGLHSSFKPFGPENYLPSVGRFVDGRRLEANAIELINSGALQTDPLLVVKDWFGLLNGGYRLAAIGASDSHDVARHFVGQGRSYVRLDPERSGRRDPASIDVSGACDAIVAGRVTASLGLLARIRLGKAGPGDTHTPETGDTIEVEVEVQGPSWSRAEEVLLFRNGELAASERILRERAALPGSKWSGRFRLPRPRHDCYLVAVARGPGIDGLHWRIPKSYQPASPDWRSYTLSVTSPVWVDADGDGRVQSPKSYAEELVKDAGNDLEKLVEALGGFDRSVAAQVADRLLQNGTALPAIEELITRFAANPAIRQGFEDLIGDVERNRAARAATER